MDTYTCSAAVARAIPGGYTLTDKNDTTYTFTQNLGGGVFGLSNITDAANRTLALAWSSGQVTTVTSGSTGRAPHLTWATPGGATAAHVAAVATDPVTAGTPSTALTWAYTYTGDQLTKVCAPVDTTGCTQYAYTTGSSYPNTVLDTAPHSYWRLSEASGTTAASSVLINEGADNGTYNGVTLGQPGPLTGSTATSAGFNGAGSVLLPTNLVMNSTASSVSLWFKTSGTGTLFSTGTSAPGTANPSSAAMPVLYVGTDGKLYGHYSNGKTAGIASALPSTTATDTGWC